MSNCTNWFQWLTQTRFSSMSEQEKIAYLNDGENIILGKMNHQSFENYEQITLSFEKDFISKCKMLNYNNKNILPTNLSFLRFHI